MLSHFESIINECALKVVRLQAILVYLLLEGATAKRRDPANAMCHTHIPGYMRVDRYPVAFDQQAIAIATV